MRLQLSIFLAFALLAVLLPATQAQKQRRARLLAKTGSVQRARFLTNLSSGSSSYSSSSRCIIYTRGCNVTSNVCGRLGSTTTCKRFKNRCLLERANCALSGTSWNVRSISYCSSISQGNTGTCSNLSTSSSSSSSTNNLSSLLSSLYASNSNVYPIIIRRG